MAVTLIEGFDHHSTTAKLAAKGWTIANVAQDVLSIVAGRLGGFAFRCASTSSSNGSMSCVKTFPAASTVVCGFAVRFSARPTTAATHIVLLDTGGGALSVQITPGGLIQITGSGFATIVTGTTAMVANTWYYIEVKLVVNGASGNVTVQLNGVAEIAQTTGNFGTGTVSRLFLRRQTAAEWGSTASVDWDDIYVLDTTGSQNTGFLGDVRVDTIFPTADGAHTDFTPNSGSDHFSRVNEASGTYPDDDTSYVSSGTVNDRDSYGFGDLSGLAGAVFAVQTNLHARKDDVGVRQIAAVARPGATDRDGATVTLTTAYVDYTEIRETNPDTSAAWTVSEVNASEFGVKVVA